MRAFGNPTVINPFDRFGDHLRLALQAPASYQLMTWLESGPGAELPDRAAAAARGRWVVCGYGRFGREADADLRAEGLEVTVIDPTRGRRRGRVIVGDGSDPAVMARADLDRRRRASSRAPTTTRPTCRWSPPRGGSTRGCSSAARQNLPASAPLFARWTSTRCWCRPRWSRTRSTPSCRTPLLWRFVQEMPGQGDAWAADVDRPADRAVRAAAAGAVEGPADRAGGAGAAAVARDGRRAARRPAAQPRRPRGAACTSSRCSSLRGDECTLAPDDDFVLRTDDELLLVGRPSARRALERTLVVDAVREYVVTGRHVPSSWIWRQAQPDPLTASSRPSRGCGTSTESTSRAPAVMCQARYW